MFRYKDASMLEGMLCEHIAFLKRPTDAIGEDRRRRGAVAWGPRPEAQGFGKLNVCEEHDNFRKDLL